MTSSTVVSSEIKRHLYFSSATCRHMSYYVGCHQCCAGHNNMQVILIILRIKRISPITSAVQLVLCQPLIPIGIILYKWNHIFAKLAMSNNKTMECILLSSSKPRSDSINSKCTDADQRYIILTLQISIPSSHTCHVPGRYHTPAPGRPSSSGG